LEGDVWDERELVPTELGADREVGVRMFFAAQLAVRKFSGFILRRDEQALWVLFRPLLVFTLLRVGDPRFRLR
jgi:hypothetical protein